MRTAVAVVGAAVILFGGALAAFPQHGLIVSDLGTTGMGLAATVGILLVADRQTDRRRRTGLFLLMWSVASWTLGEAIWATYELGLHQEVPFPSMADLGYGLAVPLMVAALFKLGPRTEPTTHARVALDGLITACCILFLGWAAVLGPIYRASGDSFVMLIAGLAYPIADIVVISTLVYSASRAPRSERNLWILLGVAIGAWTVSDSLFALTTAQGSYITGMLVDIGWFAALGFCAAAAATLRHPEKIPAPETSPKPAWQTTLAVSIATVLAAVALLVRNHGMEETLTWIGMAFVGLVLARQAVAQQEVLRSERRAILAEADQTQAKFQARFLNAAAHDMATPLTPLRMDIHRLAGAVQRPGTSPEATQEAIAGIKRQIDRLANVVTDLAKAARLQEGSLTLHRQTDDLVAVLRRVLDDAPTERLGVRIDASFPAVLHASIDAQAMEEALGRMLAFALSRSIPGDVVRVTLSTFGHEAHLVVEDAKSAPEAGLSGDLFQGYGNASAGLPGGGLGLRVSQGIIAGHGGDLSARMALPTGVALVARLPLVENRA